MKVEIFLTSTLFIKCVPGICRYLVFPANLMDRWLKWITTENTTGPEPDLLMLWCWDSMGFLLIELIQE